MYQNVHMLGGAEIMGKILLVEDNELICESLKNLIKAVDPNQIIYNTGYSAIALAYARENDVDMFLLDIELLDYSGIVLAEKIRELSQYTLTPIVFITNDYKLELEAFRNTQCYRFITKPFKAEEVKEVIRTLLEHGTKSSNRVEKFFIKKKGYTASVLQSDILYFEVVGRKLMAVTKYETIEITRCTIGDILEHVGDSFFQCHKSFVINSEWIEIIDKTNMLILLKNARGQIPYGPRYRERIEGAFN